MKNTWKSGMCILTVFVLFMAGRPLIAQDIYVEQTLEMAGMGAQQAPAQPMTMKIWFSADKMRVDPPMGRGATIIVRTDLDKMWMVNDAAKSYAERPADALKGPAAPMMGADQMQVDLKATGATKKIGEWNCQEYILSITGVLPMTMQIWATTDVKVDPAVYSQMSERMGMGANPMMAPLMEKMKTIQGFPIQTAVKMVMGNQVMETTTTVNKVSLEKIDGAVFELPEGYTKMETPAATAPATGTTPPKKGGS